MVDTSFVGERGDIIERTWKKGSFTIEAAILIPFVLLLFVGILQIGISFFQYSVTREYYEGLNELDIVRQFYNMQMLKELGKD